MTVTLEDFYIVNGDDRTLQLESEETLSLKQTTQVVPPSRAAWVVAFPDRASRSIDLVYKVLFPPCESLAAALMQSRSIWAQCPRGGVLVETHDAVQVTYAQAWITGIQPERMGVRNAFTFSLLATNPNTATLSTLAKMNRDAVNNLKDVTGLTGGGTTNLDGYATADVALGFVAFITPNIGGFAQAKHFRLITGTTATNTDPAAGTLVVRPTDYDGATNPRIWIEL
jgi:hypothetical protein